METSSIAQCYLGAGHRLGYDAGANDLPEVEIRKSGTRWDLNPSRGIQIPRSQSLDHGPTRKVIQP